jgi:O-acetyl-ADP-ribose deacetylase (regulator of RNase III)
VIVIGDRPSSRLTLRQGDLTELAVDAIVNAANEDLVMGGGVAGAIRSKGGPSIQDECDRIGHTPTGTAVITGGGKLKAKHVIHAVGPIHGTGNEDEKLERAVLSALNVAKKNGLKSIALPAISAGIFGFPKDRCAKIMISTILEYLGKNSQPKEIIIILYDGPTFEIFEHEYNSNMSTKSN